MPLDASAPRKRSAAVTVLAALAIALGVVALPIAAVAGLMLAAGSHGTGSADLRGVLTVVVAPPLALASGIGLLRRRRWAWLGMVGLSTAALAFNLADVLAPPRAPGTYVSPGGTVTHVLSTGTEHALPLAALALAALAVLLARRTRVECGVGATPAPSARTSSPPAASNAPDVARVSRVGAREDRYEDARRGGAALGAGRARHRPAATPTRSRGSALALAALLAIAAGMAWLVERGIATGATPFPGRHGAVRRSVVRAEEPAMFWVAIGLYAAVGVGTLGLATWGVREARRRVGS